MKTQKHRRKIGKTDYEKRLKFLKSEKPRVVFRKTNQYIIAQYITSEHAKDKVEMGITSKILLNYGWPKEANGSLKSIPASYLTGYCLGKRLLKKKVESPIFDIGMTRSLPKTKVYAFLKGLIDAGITMPHDKKVFPSEEKIKGKHLKKSLSTFEKIKLSIDKE
jgi:large subunit ribosomal protein L18